MSAPAVERSANGHALVDGTGLDRAEAVALSGYEQTIERGLNVYIEVGTALGQIREGRLYRADYASFEDYCQGRWGFNRHRAAQLIGAIDVVTNVTSEGLPAPANEGQARALGRVPQEQQAAVWREVNETDGKVTAEKIQAAADARKPDLTETIRETLAPAGRDGLDLKVIAAAWPEPPTDNDLLRALEKLTKSGEIAVVRAWANGKPRKWASAEALGDITPDVLGKLATFGAAGATAWRVAFLIDQPGADALTDSVLGILRQLLTDGTVSIVGEADSSQTVWALTKLLAAAPKPTEEEPAEVPTQTVEPARIAPQVRQQIEDDAERIRMVGNAHRKADRLIREVSGLITEIEAGVLLGEPGLVTAEMVAELRKQADRLERYVEESK